jgi:hypothetical protein
MVKVVVVSDMFLALQLVDLTLELRLVFIPGLMWFFDRYRKLLLLSYMPSANTLLVLLFSEALSTNFVSILPSCTSSLVTSKESIISKYTMSPTKITRLKYLSGNEDYFTEWLVFIQQEFDCIYSTD